MCVFAEDNPFTFKLITSPSLNECLELENNDAFAKAAIIQRMLSVRSILNKYFFSSMLCAARDFFTIVSTTEISEFWNSKNPGKKLYSIN